MYVERPSRGAAVASLVLGIIGVCIGLIPILGYFAIPMGLIGFILGLAGVHKAKRTGQGKALPRAGWLLSLIAVGVSIAGIAMFAMAVEELDNDLDDWSACYGSEQDQAACDRLAED
jgi:hypothetical protein